MPIVAYTEDEVIERCNEAESLGAARAAKALDMAMAENTMLRRKLNDCRDALKKISQRANESGPGQLGYLNTIYDMHTIARGAIEASGHESEAR